MKKFSSYIVGGLVAILIVMLVLDVVYTKIYKESPPRTKFQYFRSLKDKKVDYIFLGSSRVENGIVPSIIKQETGKTAVNFGFQAAKLADIYTLLQLIKEYNISYETILIQVDYIYNIKAGHSTIFEYEMMPFIRDNGVTKCYSDNYTEHPMANYYLPFYRYCSNDLKIGFREVFANVVRKKTNVIAQNGYVARFGNSALLSGGLPAVILDNNSILDSIQAFARQNKMKLVFFFAPVCRNSENQDFISKLKTKIPELKDFSRALNEDQSFIDCNHLNDSGAKRFTEIFTEEVLMNKTK
jgi:hypothetical protein